MKIMLQKLTLQKGFTLIEVLITLIIVAIGLLGLAGLQVTSLKNQMEAYQRAQAILLVEDMVNRARVNAIEARAGSYTDGEDYGRIDSDDICPADPSVATTAQNDLCAWNDALVGVDVLSSTSQNFGSIIGARGCIENLDGVSGDGDRIVRVTVAWLGASPTVEPAADCGENQFGADDRYRRVVSMDAVLANLALAP
ncbi:MAG: type IV pilus modification protein PilV [Halioglobus sp.]